MQIVIDIPEEDYEGLKKKDEFNDMYLNHYEKLIVHGTPLPKGHGRLIDVDDLQSESEHEPKSEWQKDHEILKAYSDGANGVLEEIRAEISVLDDTDYEGYCKAVTDVLRIIDKYKTESEEIKND